MFNIISGEFIDVVASNGYDHYGTPEVQISISGNKDLKRLQDTVVILEAEFRVMRAKMQEEEELRLKNPALQALYDQYKVVAKLVKVDDCIGNDGGG